MTTNARRAVVQFAAGREEWPVAEMLAALERVAEREKIVAAVWELVEDGDLAYRSNAVIASRFGTFLPYECPECDWVGGANASLAHMRETGHQPARQA